MNGEVKKRSQFASIVRRFRRNKLAVVGLIILTILILLAVSADILFDYDTQAVGQDMQNRFAKPSKDHLFGTDHYGRDIFVRVVFGTRISLIVAFSVAFFAMILGIIIGSIAGFYGGRIDNILMRSMDVLLAIPSMLLAIVIVSSLGTSLVNLILANAIARVPRFARIVRSNVLSLRDMEFVEAARASGIGNFTIIRKHLIPNSMGPVIVQATLSMALSILAVASLSFVGLGIQPPTPEWGSMLSSGKDFMRQYPHLIYFPGFAIMLAVLSFNLIGDGLRDALDPRLKN